ncbi:MAG: hypothetical protein NVSMB31_01370 [Vulcanimicrobiaceae bacterium]
MFASSKSLQNLKRDKILIYSASGYGKTHALMSWPKMALIDVETRGHHFADRFDFVHAYAETINDVTAALKEIRSGRIPCETVGFDSASAMYMKLIEAHSKLSDTGSLTTDWPVVNRRMLDLLNFIFSMSQKNVIVTAHLGEKLNRVGKDFQKAGAHFIASETLRFGFDYIYRLEPQGDAKMFDPRTTPALVIVEKSASPILKVGARFEGLSYAKHLAMTRGAEKAAPPSVPVSAPAQNEEAAPVVAPTEQPALLDDLPPEDVGGSDPLRNLTGGELRAVQARLATCNIDPNTAEGKARIWLLVKGRLNVTVLDAKNVPAFMELLKKEAAA